MKRLTVSSRGGPASGMASVHGSRSGLRRHFASLAVFCSIVLASFLTVVAGDITVGISLRVDKFSSLLNPSVSGSDDGISMAGSAMSDVVQQIPATWKTNVALGSSHGTLGWAFFRNLDATNPVVYGTDADAPFGKLYPGEAAVLRLDSTVTNISMKALTNAVYVRAWVLDN